MASLFMFDTSGDQQLNAAEGVKSSAALYNAASKDRLLGNDENSEDEDDEEAGEMELFGVKVNGKDMRKVVKSSAQETTLKPPSRVALQLTELTEKVNEAAQNSSTHKLAKRQRITDLHHDPSENMKERKANVEVDMQKTKRVPGFEQLKALPTVSKRKQPILNRVSCSHWLWYSIICDP